MSKEKVLLRLIAFFLAIVQPSIAGEKITAVFVNANAQNLVGLRFIHAVKEGIRKCAGQTLVECQADADITLHIITFDPDINGPESYRGLRTVYTAVWTAHMPHESQTDVFLSHTVGTCGTDRILEGADYLIALTDARISEILSWGQRVDTMEMKKLPPPPIKL